MILKENFRVMKIGSLHISLFFFNLPSFSSSRPTFLTPKPILQSYFPKSQAESLIRSFNLSPKYPVNIIASDTSFVPGSIVENKVPFLGASGPSVEELDHHVGYYSLLHSKAARKDDLVVIWLTGGPGCSSSLALFYENGPFSIANNMSLLLKRYGWDKVSNIMFVDQPTGTGFSYSSYEEDIRHDELGVSNDLYDFLRAFFKKHPKFVKNDFYITGESYAGHYISALASQVHKGNIKKQGIHIYLKYPTYSDFALQRGLITKEDRDSLNKLIPDCEKDIKLCQTKGGDNCSSAFETCTSIFDNLLSIIGNNINDALGVKDLDFVSCSSTLYYAMLEDWMKNLEVDIPYLLEDGIKLLVYSDQKKFKSAPKVKFIVDGVETGSLTSHGPLSFLKVYQAGHMVPMDQPKASLEMLRKWMGWKLSVSKKRD
ncbi:hypothetical protein Lal_00012618 [Lupinus albus]|nr:hypothetical protein Lal_00012618 [Lupinus albus]